MIAVLHPWGQIMRRARRRSYADGQWASCRPDFFLPVRVLSRRSIGAPFLQHLRAAFDGGKLEVIRRSHQPARTGDFRQPSGGASRFECIVYVKRPLLAPSFRKAAQSVANLK
jgi:hypothetical protein